MQISFHEWEDSPLTHRAAASIGSDEVQVWIATAPSDEAGLTALACQLNPDERARAAARSRRDKHTSQDHRIGKHSSQSATDRLYPGQR